MNISDHGELDYLTPAPTDVDHAIAHAIREQLSRDIGERTTYAEQMQRNGLEGVSLDAWLQS